MIILVVHINGIWAIEYKSYSPVATHSDGPAPTTLTFQFMEIETWQIHISRVCSGMEAAENQSNSAFMLRLDASLRPFQKELFKPLMFEILNHSSTVTRYVTGVNYWRRITPLLMGTRCVAACPD